MASPRAYCPGSLWRCHSLRIWNPKGGENIHLWLMHWSVIQTINVLVYKDMSTYGFCINLPISNMYLKFLPSLFPNTELSQTSESYEDNVHCYETRREKQKPRTRLIRQNRPWRVASVRSSVLFVLFVSQCSSSRYVLFLSLRSLSRFPLIWPCWFDMGLWLSLLLCRIRFYRVLFLGLPLL